MRKWAGKMIEFEGNLEDAVFSSIEREDSDQTPYYKCAPAPPSRSQL